MKLKKLKVTRLEPIGRSKKPVMGSSDKGPFYEVETYDYPPPSPEAVAFRKLRREELNIPLFETSRILGIRNLEVSKLEHGEATCDWAEAERMLRAARQK